MLMKEKLVPVVSVLVGLLAFVLTYQYLRGERRKLEAERARIYEGAAQVYVVAARHDIPSGTVIKPTDLGKLKVFKTSVGSHVVTPEEADMLLGRKTLFLIKAREPVFWSHIEGGQLAAMGLAPIVKPGMRAISLSVAGAEAVSGMVQPNDRVDILGTFSFPSKTVPGDMKTVTLTVLQDVTVLATGQRLAKQAASGRASRAGGYSTVTVEVTPREAEMLVFAQQLKGSLTLSLRNPSDVSFEKDLPEVDFEQIETSLQDLNLYRQRNIRYKKNP
jgi:pilus assembly protein CpaB